MKLTSKDIQEKTFEKNFRGYDKDEVTAFLVSIANAWDKLEDEKAALERELEISKREAQKLKDVEESLFRTLKTAEDTGVSIIEEANQAANEIVAEAKTNAEQLISNAEERSSQLLDASESKANQLLADLKADVKKLINEYESLLEQRDLVLKNLEKLNEDILESLSDSRESFKKVDIQAHLSLVAELETSKAFTIANLASTVSTIEPAPDLEISADEIETLLPEADQTSISIEDELEVEPTDGPVAEVSDAEDIMEETTPEAEESKQPKPDKGSSFFDQFD